MIHRCETCPFWKRSIKQDNQHKQSNWGTCEKAHTHLMDIDVRGDGEGIKVSLSTRINFGCVQHPMNKAIA